MRSRQLELNARLNGRVTRPSNDPPRIIPIPWNTLTLDTQYTFSSSVNTEVIKFSDLYTIFAAQFGIAVDLSTQISFRMIGLQAWEVSGASIVMNVQDLFSKTSYIQQVEDDPGRNRWATVGYRYPDAMSRVVGAGNANDTVCTLSGVETGIVKFRAHILWRFRYSNLPTRRMVHQEP